MRREAGFSYVIVMFLVAVLSLLAARAMENTLTAERRQKEDELLRVGQAYRDAIRSYYEQSPGTAKVYPPTLEALLLDGRGTRLRRPLRKLFRDPMNSDAKWGVLEAEGGGVMGVYSLSTLKPIKTDGFPAELAGFTNAKHYSEWQFTYQPQ
ncbi:MAG: type II secretion system protein [Pseudomonadota bacterium]